VGLALVADHFVLAVLTEKYAAAILPLRILALYASVRAITPMLAPVLIAMGQTRLVLWNNFMALVLLPTAFLVGSRWGTAGIAAAWAVAHPIVVGQIAWRVFRAIDLRARDYFAAIAPAFIACAVMAVAVLGIRYLLPSDLPPAIALPIEVAAGAAAYAGVLVGRYRERLNAFRRFIRTARERKTA
jgi:O-antigen/teichoic acid export membrane protein